MIIPTTANVTSTPVPTLTLMSQSTATTSASSFSTLGINEMLTIAFGIVASLTAVMAVLIGCMQLKRTRSPRPAGDRGINVADNVELGPVRSHARATSAPPTTGRNSASSTLPVDNRVKNGCHRLKKPCHPGDSIRRQAADNTQRANARIADLEGKLSSLVSLLQERNVIDKDASATSDTGAGYDEPQLREADESGGLDNNTARDLNSQEQDDEPQYTASVLSPPLTGSPGTQMAPTPMTAVSGPSTDASAEDLERFRSLLLPNFPFIFFPPDKSFEKLQKERPFLCEAIRCVAPPSASEKRTRARKLKHILGEMMFGEEKTSSNHASMDLLLGLLVYIAWGWDHVLSGCSLTRLMTFATTLVGEMRLDKPGRRLNQTQFFAPGMQHNDIDKSGITNTQILEYQRAVIGCFALSSAVSAYFGEMEPLKWTSQMNEGLAALEAHQELSDKALVFQVRLQLLATRSAQYDPQASMTGLPSTAILEGQMFLSQLQDIRASVESENLPKQGVLQAYTHYTELRILEAGSQIRPHEPSEMCPRPLANMTALPSDSVFCLWKAELAVNACARALVCLPASAFLGASFIQSIQWSHLANCIAILCHLAKSYHHPGADPAVERAIGELPGVLDRLADSLSAAAAEAGENWSDDVLTQLADGMRKFRSSIDAEADSSGVESGSGTATSTVPFRNPGAWLGHIWDELSS